MQKIGLILLSLALSIGLQAQDKLDILDKQSKEFFKAITGLEKDYLEEQIQNIKNKKETIPSQSKIQHIDLEPEAVEKEISQEEYEKKVFIHENEMARLTTDFTRTKKLKDISIKSMYSFNGKNFVNLKLENLKNRPSNTNKESSLSIEGRYTTGDYILTHKIIDINTRTKTVKLYKKLDEEYGYVIYLSNYGISVSNLQKRAKKEEKPNKKNELGIKEKFKKIANKPVSESKSEENISSCLYTVNVNNLNVRNSTDFDATILRILRVNDQFSILEKQDKWLKIDTIYKKISGDVMNVKDQNNWVNITDINVIPNKSNCL